MDLVLADACLRGVRYDVGCPGGGPADVDVGVLDVRDVGGEAVAVAHGVLGKPGGAAMGPRPGEVEEPDPAFLAEIQDFIAEVELLLRVAAEQYARLPGSERRGFQQRAQRSDADAG